MIRATAIVCLATACLAACGGSGRRHATPPPALPQQLAATLAARADEVAAALDAGDSCRAATLAHQLQRDTIAAVNVHRIPPALQEQVSGSVNDLAARIVCVPPPQPPDEGHDHGKHKGHDKKHEGDK